MILAEMTILFYPRTLYPDLPYDASAIWRPAFELAPGPLISGQLMNPHGYPAYLYNQWYANEVHFRTVDDEHYYETVFLPHLYRGKAIYMQAGSRKIGESVLMDSVYLPNVWS